MTKTSKIPLKANSLEENTIGIKTIFCPTDFSDQSADAIRIAGRIAEKTNASIVVFHAYKIPFVDEYMPGTMVENLMQENEEKANADLKAFLRSQHLDNGNITLEAKMGFTAETIADGAGEAHADLIVMSTQGCNSVEDRMFGTVTWNTIRFSSIPVLAIPQDADIPEGSNIIFPFECIDEDIDVLKHCLMFGGLFKSKVYAIHFMQDGTVANKAIVNKINTTFRKEIADGDLNLNFVVDKNITEAITRFAETHAAGAIVMITHHMGFMATIFHMSTTRHIALYNNIPLLAFNARA